MLDDSAYLDRLSYTGPTAPTLETLRALHLAHLYAVPFENLDIHIGRKIILDEEKLFDKIVSHRRGGFCYELNGLFAALLRALSFDVTLLAAGVWNLAHQRFDPEFDHLCLLVRLEERWLADVGFGDTFREPLRLDDPGEQIQNGKAYRIERDGDWWIMHEPDSGGRRAATALSSARANWVSLPSAVTITKPRPTRLSPKSACAVALRRRAASPSAVTA